MFLRKELESREMALELKTRELEARQKTAEENVDVENGSDSPAPSSPSSSSSISSSSSSSSISSAVQIREWEVAVREFEVVAREEAVGKREVRVVARENRAVEHREKLKIFESHVIKQKEDAVKFNEELSQERSRMVLKELAIKSKKAALANDWTLMEKSMIQRWKNAKALEEELLDVEKKKSSNIREEAVMKSEGKQPEKNNYDE